MSNIYAASPDIQHIKCNLLYVIDGDTLIVKTDSREKLRLIGVDTPEPWFEKKMAKDARRAGVSMVEMKLLGQQATNYVKNRLSAHYDHALVLELDIDKRDKYGRLLGYLWLPDGKMLNREIIRSGHGKSMLVFPNDKYYKNFLKEEKRARESQLGLWAKIKRRW
ncbi:MAG: thermonuclease [Proteobacteria bacterium]|nr:thermonuclease [Pseudomonadota bacterium]